MASNLLLTGLLFAPLLLVPAILKNYDPPTWIKAIILVPALSGVLMIIVGLLMIIWEQ